MSINRIKNRLFERFAIEIDESLSTDEIDYEIKKREGKADATSNMEQIVLEYAKVQIEALKSKDCYP
ncbi:MAG: hypothetical protein CMI54_01565 [Parcubacteria group bacterium]|nr:hypothetical protein [Parcubacteria group bacterium]|tara:strand:- start:30290 stop:30490 length:201 start_codon:yes stop_codon:yes gene_type:complete